MEQFQFDIDVNPDAREIESLRDHVGTFNVEETKIHDYKELAIFLRDSMSPLIAGIRTYTSGSCLDIRLLWVREGFRGAGLGSKLMHAVERRRSAEAATSPRSRHIVFRRLVFCEKLGHEEIGVLDGYPIGHKKHYLKKGAVNLTTVRRRFTSLRRRLVPHKAKCRVPVTRRASATPRPWLRAYRWPSLPHAAAPDHPE